MQTEAYIANGTGSTSVTVGNGGVAILASDSPEIDAAAGAIAAAGVFGDGFAAGTLGLSAAVNQIADTVYTYIDGATVKSGTGDIAASSMENGRVVAITIGGAISVAGGGDVGVGVGGAGAGSGNTIHNDVESHIDDNANVATQSSGSVIVNSVDSSTIIASGGGVAGGVGIAGEVGVGVSVGVSFASNTIGNTIHADISNAAVNAASSVSVLTGESAKVFALTLGGAVAVGGAGEVGVGVSLYGADSINIISDDAESFITGALQVAASNGSVTTVSSDHSSILAGSGGFGVAVGVGFYAGVAVSLGAAAANNVITNTAESYIDGSRVDATLGDVDLYAFETAKAQAVSAGGTATVGLGIGGASLAAAGSASTNKVNNIVQALIRDGATVNTHVGGNIELQATDSATISADAGAGALAIQGGIGGASIAVGAGVAINTVGDTVQALIDGPSANPIPSSTVISANRVSLSRGHRLRERTRDRRRVHRQHQHRRGPQRRRRRGRQ